jgi:hypothetical protein
MYQTNLVKQEFIGSKPIGLLLPFVYTAMDGACLAEVQLIVSVKGGKEPNADAKELNFGIPQLSPVGGYEK